MSEWGLPFFVFVTFVGDGCEFNLLTASFFFCTTVARLPCARRAIVQKKKEAVNKLNSHRVSQAGGRAGGERAGGQLWLA